MRFPSIHFCIVVLSCSLCLAEGHPCIDWLEKHDNSGPSNFEYGLITERLTWAEADSVCQAEGGYLTDILSQNDNDFLRGFYSAILSENDLPPPGDNRVWIGLYSSNLMTEGYVWKTDVWPHETYATYTNFVRMRHSRHRSITRRRQRSVPNVVSVDLVSGKWVHEFDYQTVKHYGVCKRILRPSDGPAERLSRNPCGAPSSQTVTPSTVTPFEYQAASGSARPEFAQVLLKIAGSIIVNAILPLPAVLVFG